MRNLSFLAPLAFIAISHGTRPLPAQSALLPTPDAAQQAACKKYNLEDRCPRLLDEFLRKGILQHGASAVLQPRITDERFRESIRKYALLALLPQKSQVEQKLLQAISTGAAVTQTGSSASTGGSTNLTAKPTTTDFLSIASESGAFTDTANGTSVTLQANANGLSKYLANKPLFAPAGHKLSDALQNLTFTVTLNIAQSSGSAVATTGSATSTPLALASVLLPSNNASFSSFQASYMIFRPLNPSSKKASTLVEAALTKNQTALDTTTSGIADALRGLGPALINNVEIEDASNEWIASAKLAEQSTSPQAFDDLLQAYDKYYSTFSRVVTASANFNQKALALDLAFQAYAASVHDVINDVRGKPLATVTYTYAAPTQLPSTHQGTLIGSYLFKGGHHDDGVRTFLSGAQFTATVYSSLPAGATYGRFRDVQLSSEFDNPVGGSIDEPRATLSVAGYGQYQYDPTVLNITAGNLAPGTNITLPSNAQVLLGTAGWLGVVQGKIAINLKPGLSLPIAIKYSNKTNLLQANDIRGQIGLSYDLSALSKLISAP